MMVFEYVHKKPPTTFEVRVVLIRAVTADQADRKGRQFGRKEQHSYTNALGEPVRVRFKEILDVRDLSWIQKPAEGDEVFYAFMEQRSLAEMRRALTRKITDDASAASLKRKTRS